MPKRRENFNQKVRYVLYVILYFIMYTIIVEILFEFSLQIQLFLFSEIIIENWGIGMIFGVLFAFLYIVDYETIPLVIFRVDKINKWFFLFWISWMLGDWQNLLAQILQLLGGV